MLVPGWAYLWNPTGYYALEHLHNAQLTTDRFVKPKAPQKTFEKVIQKRNLWHFYKMNKGEVKLKTSRSVLKT